MATRTIEAEMLDLEKRYRRAPFGRDRQQRT